MRRVLEDFQRDYNIQLSQVECTQLAEYGGDILVEHDMTFDLYNQIRRRAASLSAWWDWRRWRWFETKAVRRRISRAARLRAENHFDWRRLGEKQCALWRELLGASTTIRQADGRDLDSIARIQAASPEASQWNPSTYFDYKCLVVVVGGEVAGFVVLRTTSGQEHEILNLAVATNHRRRGLATLLMERVMERASGDFFLEVRESNRAARRLYGKLGFLETGLRQNYYNDPAEPAIVMRFQSC